MTRATTEARGAIHHAAGMQVAEAASQDCDAKPVDVKAKKKTKNATEFLKIFTFHAPLEPNYSFFTHTRRIDKFARSLIKRESFSSVLYREGTIGAKLLHNYVSAMCDNQR